MTEPTDVIFGWAAPKIRDQLPQLCPPDADTFQKDHDDLLRLKVRELIIKSELEKAFRRLVKRIEAAIRWADDIRGTK